MMPRIAERRAPTWAVKVTGVMLVSAVVLVPGTLSAAGAPWEPEAVPYGDTAVQHDTAAKLLWVAAAGLADGRGRLTGQGVRARAEAERRAIRKLQLHVDVVLEREDVAAAVAERVHEAVEGATQVVGERPLADGSAVVTVQLPLAPLTAAWPPGEKLWAY